MAKVIPVEEKIIVEGMNIKKKHIKPKKQGQKGHIAQISAPFYAANAMVICSSYKKTARTGYKMEGDKKIRVCKKCMEQFQNKNQISNLKKMNKFKEKFNKVAVPGMNKNSVIKMFWQCRK